VTTKLRLSAKLIQMLIVAITFTLGAFPLHAQSRTFTEWATPTANSEPLHVVALNGNVVFFSERTTGIESGKVLASCVGSVNLTRHEIWPSLSCAFATQIPMG
jgi:hypothetical protein